MTTSYKSKSKKTLFKVGKVKQYNISSFQMSAIRQQEQQMRLWVPTEFLMFQILMIMVLFAFFSPFIKDDSWLQITFRFSTEILIRI